MKQFKGIFTALLTPFDKDGNINAKVLEELIEYNIKLGVTGFYACGSTAEVFLLSDSERRELMRIVSEVVAGRVTLIAHVGAISTREAISLANLAEELGYDAISAVAPFYYKFSADEVCGYYRDIAESSSLKMLIYNIPAFSGVSLGVDRLSELLSNERFLGIKHTSSDFFALETLKSRFPDRIFYNGYDEMLLSGLAAGADGGIGSTYNFMADKYVRLCELFHAGRIDEAKALQHEANDIINILVKVGVNAGEKAILNLLGFDFGGCRRPFFDCDRDAYALLKREVLPKLTTR